MITYFDDLKNVFLEGLSCGCERLDRSLLFFSRRLCDFSQLFSLLAVENAH